jgi:hypothetical protein
MTATQKGVGRSNDVPRKLLLREQVYGFGRAVQNWINERVLNSLDP